MSDEDCSVIKGKNVPMMTVIVICKLILLTDNTTR